MTTIQKTAILTSLLFGALVASAQNPQPVPPPAMSAPVEVQSGETQQQVVVVTGARFSYKLVQKWIDEYNQVNPGIQIVIEARGSNDPAQYDVLAEVCEHPEEFRKAREYVYVGRYAILPVATENSEFAITYSEKGLSEEIIKQVFFHDIFSASGKEKSVKAPHRTYTRLQKAGVPAVFAQHFGYEQKDIKGVAIAGADEHLVKAVLRDSMGVTYLPLPLAYNEQTRKAVDGLVILPVDLNGNGKISPDEKFYSDIDKVIDVLEAKDPRDIENIPVQYLHLSLDRQTASQAAIDFLKWVSENGDRYLHEFGYLKADPNSGQQFAEFASKRRR